MIRQLARRLIPPAVVAKLPLHVPQTPPIASMYVADGETRSFVGLHNFYSYLLADEATDATAALQFFAPDGTRVLEHELPLRHFGATAVDVHALFAKHGVHSAYGIVAVQITPRWPRRFAYRELGSVSSQFFVFFHSAGSVAQVHPLSELGPGNAPGEPFESSQVITTRGLAAIELFQYNPGIETQPIEHRLLDAATGAIVAREAFTCAGLGSHRTRFELADPPEHLLFAVDRLPSGNSKPMLRRRFASGVHTMSHA
ncbi:MAG: hypothetical protein ABI867_15270 [Kofleriaceae bacterium]